MGFDFSVNNHSQNDTESYGGIDNNFVLNNNNNQSNNNQSNNLTSNISSRTSTNDLQSKEGVVSEVIYGSNVHLTRPPRRSIGEGTERQIVFYDGNTEAFGLDKSLLSKHLLLLGGIGSGKSNVFNLSIDSLLPRMGERDIMFIFDTKGDFERNFYNKSNPNHSIIGNDKKYENITKYWNVFEELMNEDGRYDKKSELDAMEIAKQFFVGREDSSQPFFSQAATDLVSKVMIHLMREATRTGKEDMLSTETLVSFLKGANLDVYHQVVNSKANPDFKSAELYFGQPGQGLTPQALGVFGNVNAMVDDLFKGIFAECRNYHIKTQRSFSMKDFVKKRGGRVVFVEYDLSTGEILGPMYRLLFDLALKAALGGRDEKDGNVYMIIDEFKLLPNLMHIDDALNFGRSLGVKVIAGLQSINQLYDIYGEEHGKVLAAGFMNSICFQTMDFDSREYISKRFGYKYEYISLRRDNNLHPINRDGNVVEDWDVISLDVGEAFVNIVGYNPFFFKFENFEDKYRKSARLF